ncbi:SPFH domain-containing protein [Massilia suwonensis]|uniref:SPFH domain-containing protein n=1 Tax=Massilia suwonensis TaxID=648895 RepID=A0ABW0MSG8_9BURK
MAQMFGFGGSRCPRCEHRNAGGAGYCAACGITLGAPRTPVLVDNRWIAGPDELAVFFGVRALSGLFVKTLRVPATARAYILQGGQATEVPQGEYEIEGFFSRLNHLLRDGHAEILVTRTGALPVDFSFDDLETAEHLAVGAQFSVSVRIENVPAFARHFMTMPGTVTTGQLRDLLTPAVRQLASEFVGARSLREMAGRRELRAEFDERLQGALRLLLADYGLGVVAVDTLALRHDKFDANRARIGTLWLAADERRVKLEHARQLEELYDEGEWHKITREEQNARLRLRQLGLRQNETLDRAELTLANAERAQAVRARELDLFARVAESKSRREAVERGAGEILAELEHELAQRRGQRAVEQAEWRQLQGLAAIRMRGALEVAQQEALQARTLARQRFSQQLLTQQIRNKVEQAKEIEDASRQRAELARLRALEEEAAQRARALDEEEHKAQFDLLVLANTARRRALEREEEWLELQGQARVREHSRADDLEAEAVKQRLEALRREGGQQEAIAQHEKLLRTIEAEHRQARAAKEVELLGEERLRQHALELGRLEIARNESIGQMDDTAKLAVAAAPNAAVLADYLKTRVHAGMDADQLAALAGVVAAGGAMSAMDALRLAQETLERERARRELEVDKDRRHQLDLLALQNDVNKTALNAQAQAVAGTSRACANGHPARPEDRFCGACGAPLP